MNPRAALLAKDNINCVKYILGKAGEIIVDVKGTKAVLYGAVLKVAFSLYLFSNGTS